MIVVGLDAATKTGFAVLERSHGREHVHAAGVIHVSPANIERFAAEWAPLASLVVVEDPFMQKNVVTLKELAGIARVWEHVFAARGVAVRRCTAQSWQSAILAGLMSGRAKREERKRAAVKWARLAYRLELPEDAADGLGLAVWGARFGQ